MLLFEAHQEDAALRSADGMLDEMTCHQKRFLNKQASLVGHA
jgi:hypothetical protein